MPRPDTGDKVALIKLLIENTPGMTREELQNAFEAQAAVHGLEVKNSASSIGQFMRFADDHGIEIVEGRFYFAIDVPMEPSKSVSENNLVVTDASSLSGRRSGAINAQRTDESKGRDGIDLTVTSSPLNYSNVTEIRVEYLNGTIVKEEVPTWTDLRICIGPEYPEGWHKVKTYRNVKFLYVFIGESEKATPIQPIGNDIYVGPK